MEDWREQRQKFDREIAETRQQLKAAKSLNDRNTAAERERTLEIARLNWRIAHAKSCLKRYETGYKNATNEELKRGFSALISMTRRSLISDENSLAGT